MPACPVQYQARVPSFSPAAGELAPPGVWPEQLQHQAALPATEDAAGTREARGGSVLPCCSGFPGIPREGGGRKAMKHIRSRIYPASIGWGLPRRVLTIHPSIHGEGVCSPSQLSRTQGDTALESTLGHSFREQRGSGKRLFPRIPERQRQDPNLCSPILLPDQKHLLGGSSPRAESDRISMMSTPGPSLRASLGLGGPTGWS